jgi:hypothetical protein
MHVILSQKAGRKNAPKTTKPQDATAGTEPAAADEA